MPILRICTYMGFQYFRQRLFNASGESPVRPAARTRLHSVLPNPFETSFGSGVEEARFTKIAIYWLLDRWRGLCGLAIGQAVAPERLNCRSGPRIGPGRVRPNRDPLGKSI